MNNNNTPLLLAKWPFLIYDLDAVAELSNLLRTQNNKDSSFSVCTLYEANTVITSLEHLYQQHENIKALNISVRELSKRIHFNDTDKNDIVSTKRILELLSRSDFINNKPLFIVENVSPDIKKLHLSDSFFSTSLLLNQKSHNFLKINKHIYANYLKKIKKNQRAYAVFLEKLFLSSKAKLEQLSASSCFDRNYISLKRIAKTFKPTGNHSAKELWDAGSKALKKIFGEDIDQQINKLAATTISEKESKKFLEKKVEKISKFILSDYSYLHPQNDDKYPKIEEARSI